MSGSAAFEREERDRLPLDGRPGWPPRGGTRTRFMVGASLCEGSASRPLEQRTPSGGATSAGLYRCARRSTTILVSPRLRYSELGDIVVTPPQRTTLVTRRFLEETAALAPTTGTGSARSERQEPLEFRKSLCSHHEDP